MALALKRVKAQKDRITDAHVNEAMELDRYKAEMEKLRVRRQDAGGPGHARGVDVIRVRDGKVAEKLSYVKG